MNNMGTYKKSGIPVRPAAGRGVGIFGDVWLVDGTSGNDGNTGKNPGAAFKTLTKVFSTGYVGKNDIIYCAPGGYAGNFSTPLNADAAFVGLYGVNATDRGYGPWLSASTQTSAILSVRARGWRISGFEFDTPTGAAGLLLTTSGTSNANFAQIDNCLFTGGAGTGKYGIDWYGAPTYTYVGYSRFDGHGASGATCFVCSYSGTDVPRMCTIEFNEFQENTGHIAMNPRGFKSTVIRGNVFGLDGISRDATVLLDTRGGGGNAIVQNYFDITKAQYIDDSSTAFVRTSATDFGAGNWCSDGDPGGVLTDTDDISH